MIGLWDSWTLRCGRTVQGRAALAPLTNTQSRSDGTLSDVELRWLARRAQDGFPWVSTCATYVSDQGKAWDGQLGAAHDLHGPGLARLAEALHAGGAFSVVQLHHGGAKASLATGGPIAADDADGARAANPAELDQVVADMVAAARRAEEAGFSGVEVHGANGYLFTQFLAPGTNHRTDRWGGSLPNRARLLRDAVRAVRAALRPETAVGVRLSPVDVWDQRGLVLQDGVTVGRWLAEDGVDWVHLSLGDASGPPRHEPEAGPVARAFRDALPSDVAVLAAGGVWTVQDARQAFRAGADIVVVGRAGIVHPDWPRVADAPDFAPIRPPWSIDRLRAVDVGPAFARYLSRFPGLVEGGAPSR